MKGYSYKDVAICALLWVFGRGVGAHYFYLGRPLHALVWTMTDYLFSLGWIVDLILIPKYIKDIKSLHASPSESIQQHNASRVILLMAAEVWYSVVCTGLAITCLMEMKINKLLTTHVVLFIVPLGVWWICRTYNHGLSIKAAAVSGVLGYGLSYYVKDTIITQGGPLADQLHAKFLLISPAIFTTLLANTWLHRTYLSHQLMRLLKGFVKLVLVFLLCLFIVGIPLRIYYKTYRTNDNSRTEEDFPRTMSENEKLLRACEILTVHPAISQDLLTVHYRHLARQWHPDKHMDPASKEEATHKFIQMQDAYEYLSQRVTHSKGKQKK